MKKIAILQSNYIPWKGYFDIINMVDEFILYDDMQYTRRDWRNRNKIKTSQGLQWLTISVLNSGKFLQKINETEVIDSQWCHDHWRAISLNYAKAPYFKIYAELMEEIYHRCEKETHLSRINYLFLTKLCALLDIHTKITWSSDYKLVDGKTERLVALCQSAGGNVYLSGPIAKKYIVDSLFEEAGITLQYIDYSGYPEYHQLFGPFEHGVTILDLLFNEGPKARRFMKS